MRSTEQMGPSRRIVGPVSVGRCVGNAEQLRESDHCHEDEGISHCSAVPQGGQVPGGRENRL